MIVPTAGPLIGTLPLFLIATLAPQIRAQLGIDTAQLGLVTSAFFIGAIASGVPTAPLRRRLGSVASVRLGMLVSALATAGVALAVNSVAGLVACLFLMGAALGVIDPASGVYIARFIDPRRHGLAFGIKLATFPVASLLCGLALAFLAEPLGWRWIFGLSAVLAAVLCVIIPARPDPGVSLRKSGWRIRDRRALLTVAIAAGCGFAAMNAFGVFIVSTAVNAGLSLAITGVLVAVGGIAAIVARVVAGLRADHEGSNPLDSARLGLAVCGVAFAALGVASFGNGSRIGIAILMPFAYLVAWAWTPFLQVFLASHFGPGADAAFGLVNTAACTGAILGPALFGALANGGSYFAGWLSLALWVAFACVLLTSLRRHRDALTAR